MVFRLSGHHRLVSVKRVPTDDDRHQELLEKRSQRFPPFTISPFAEAGNITEKSIDGSPSQLDADEIAEVVSHEVTWRDCFLDLALVACLSVVSDRRPVLTGQQVATYVAFFALLWYFYMSQLLYDARYQVDDDFHRTAKFIQLAILCMLAAFSANFDVYRIWTTNTDVTTFDGAQSAFNINSFKGLLLTFAIGRWFLALQYFVVFFYSHHRRSSGVFLHPLSSLFSGFCFLAAYLMPDSSYSVAVGKLILAYGSLVIDAFVSFMVGILRTSSFREESMMFERLALVTLIIIGEGVIGFCATLSNVIGAVGFDASRYLQIFSGILILYLVFWELFDGMPKRAKMMRLELQVFLWSHFFLHIALLLFLQGLYRTLEFTSFRAGALILITQLYRSREAILAGTFSFANFPVLAQALNQLAIPYNTTSIETAYNGTISQSAIDSTLYTFFIQAVSTLYTSFGYDIEASTRVEINAIVSDPTLTNEDQLRDILVELLGNAYRPALYIFPALGGIYLLSWVIRWMYCPMQDRYDRIMAAVRAALGFGLCMLGFLGIGHQYINIDITLDDPASTGGPNIVYRMLQSGWILPMICIIMFLHAVSERYVIARSRSLSSRKRQLDDTISGHKP